MALLQYEPLAADHIRLPALPVEASVPAIVAFRMSQLCRQMAYLAERRVPDSVLWQSGMGAGSSLARDWPAVGPEGNPERFCEALAACDAAGFGRFTLLEFQPDSGRASIRASDVLEPLLRSGADVRRHGCAFTAGLLAGLAGVLWRQDDIVCMEDAPDEITDGSRHFELLPAGAGVEPEPGSGRPADTLAGLLAEAAETAVAAERARLARDLHDAVTQTLFSASTISGVLPDLWERDRAEGRRRLEELRQLTRGALAEMRMLLLDLRPAALDEASLADLLTKLAEASGGRGRIPVSLHVTGSPALPADVKAAFYRIAQEAMNNVLRHARAAQAHLSLTCLPGAVNLSITDDGRGFDPEQATPGHFGLAIMRERAEAVGAGLHINSRPGLGTRVDLVWPQAR